MLVTAEDGKQYVLKIFSKNDAKQRWYTGAEILGYLTAKQLDINIPNASLLSLTDEYLTIFETFNTELFQELEGKKIEKLLFGSELLTHNFAASQDKRILKFIDTIELENLYAFDILINNQDRREEKPNAIIKDNLIFAIDHEKAFEGLEFTRRNLLRGNLPYFYEHHLVYKELKLRRRRENVKFETFEENLRYLDIHQLERQIKDTYISDEFISDVDEWLNHLSEIKKNYPKFVSVLRETFRK